MTSLPFPAGDSPTDEEVADWVEYSALSGSADFKRGDLKSAISRENVGTPDLLEEQVWSELRRRKVLFGSNWPLVLSGNRLRKRASCRSDTLIFYRYLCLLALGDLDDEDRKLFEELVRDAISPHFGSNALRIGHPASAGQSTSFRERVLNYGSVAAFTHTELLAAPLPHDKDMGLDVVGWHAFSDGRGGNLHFLLQCATGRNWQGKWDDVKMPLLLPHINWAVTPVRVFCVPVVARMPQDQWIRMCRQAGVVLDRPRLLEIAKHLKLKNDRRNFVIEREMELAA